MNWVIALTTLQLALQASACALADFNVVGRMQRVELPQGVPASCLDTWAGRCWDAVQVRQCKDGNATQGVEGELLLLPVLPAASVYDGSTWKFQTCPEARGTVAGGVSAAGVVTYRAENATDDLQEEFVLSSTDLNTLMLTLPQTGCFYNYRLEMSTSKILNTEPLEYGMPSSAAWSADAGRALAVAAALAGAALLL